MEAKLTYTELLFHFTMQYNSQTLKWSLQMCFQLVLFVGVWCNYQIIFSFTSILLCLTPINSSSSPSSSWWPWLRLSDSFLVMQGTCKRRYITHTMMLCEHEYIFIILYADLKSTPYNINVFFWPKQFGIIYILALNSSKCQHGCLKHMKVICYIVLALW